MCRINPKVDFAFKKLFGSEEEREIYENDLKRLRDHIAEIETAEIRGMEKGMEKGIEKGIEKGAVLSRREDIIDNLSELEPITNEIVKVIDNEDDIEILKKWLKISARVNSLEEFIRKIRE